MHVFLRSFVYLLCFSVGLVIISVLIFRESAMQALISYLQAVQAGEASLWTLLGLGILQVLIPIALTLRWLAVRRFARELSYMTANGRVSVNLQAIEEALARAAVNGKGVKHIVVRVYEDRIRRQVIIQAVLTLWDENNITGATQRCQEILSQRFQELMPEQRSVQVQVSVNRLNQQRGTEFTTAVQAETEGHRITPGLAATDGEINNAAGRALLQQTKRKRTDDGEIRERSVTDYAHNDHAEHKETKSELPIDDKHPTSVTEIDENNDMYANLYHGPQYAVPDDDDNTDVTGSALPVDS